MLNLNHSTWSFTTPRHLHAPHWPIQLTSSLAVLYYALTNPHSYLPYAGIPVNDAKWTLIVLCVVTNTVWSTLDVSRFINYHQVDEKRSTTVTRKSAAAVAEADVDDDSADAVSSSRSRRVRKAPTSASRSDAH
jgi:hypothetical protein